MGCWVRLVRPASHRLAGGRQKAEGAARRRVPPILARRRQGAFVKVEVARSNRRDPRCGCGVRPVVVFCTTSDKAVAANPRSTALGLFREVEGLLLAGIAIVEHPRRLKGARGFFFNPSLEGGFELFVRLCHVADSNLSTPLRTQGPH